MRGPGCHAQVLTWAVTLQPNEVGQENHARIGEHVRSAGFSPYPRDKIRPEGRTTNAPLHSAEVLPWACVALPGARWRSNSIQEIARIVYAYTLPRGPCLNAPCESPPVHTAYARDWFQSIRVEGDVYSLFGGAPRVASAASSSFSATEKSPLPKASRAAARWRSRLARTGLSWAKLCALAPSFALTPRQLSLHACEITLRAADDGVHLLAEGLEGFGDRRVVARQELLMDVLDALAGGAESGLDVGGLGGSRDGVELLAGLERTGCPRRRPRRGRRASRPGARGRGRIARRPRCSRSRCATASSARCAPRPCPPAAAFAFASWAEESGSERDVRRRGRGRCVGLAITATRSTITTTARPMPTSTGSRTTRARGDVAWNQRPWKRPRFRGVGFGDVDDEGRDIVGAAALVRAGDEARGATWQDRAGYRGGT